MSKASSQPTEAKKWNVAFVFAFLFAVPSAFYTYTITGNITSLTSWSFIFAAVSSLLFAVSFAAGSISYYFGFPNMRHGYQKQIGVLAFWIALAYSITLPILHPETYWYGLSESIKTPDVSLGLIAMTIFGAMVLINSKWIALFFSWPTIKAVLGLGFVAYALLVVRAVFIEWGLWEDWLISPEGFPPGRLALSAVALFVLLLRLSVSAKKAITGERKRK